MLYEVVQWPVPAAGLSRPKYRSKVNFLVADRWVFGHRLPMTERLITYHGAAVGAFVAYWLVINGLSGPVGLPYILLFAFALGTGGSFAWSLLTNFLWVWAQPSRN